jgi:hypothetical protein
MHFAITVTHTAKKTLRPCAKNKKVGFSGFSLGNWKKIAFVANANFSPFSAKMAGA